MNRSELLLVSLGGGGNKLADTIMNLDNRYQGLFINTSITDLQSLDNCDSVIKNYICISTQNGVGRNRDLGKSYAESYAMTIIERIMNYVQQDTVYFISSLGGGSGSSILSVLLEKLDDLKKEGSFDKIINLICIIPDLKSPDVILKNSLNTWSEVLRRNSCINSMIFVDNNTNIDNITDIEIKEKSINDKFADLFDAVFDIPDNNGSKFDTGNLSNILKDRGCLYIYDLPSGCTNIREAFRKSENDSVLAKVFKNNKNTYYDSENKKSMLKCGYIGISLTDENYNKSEIEDDYILRNEFYTGRNEEKNLVLISGCLPPSDTMQVIKLELDEREKSHVFDDDSLFFTDFTNDTINKPNDSITEKQSKASAIPNANKTLKKVMKKSLFKK